MPSTYIPGKTSEEVARVYGIKPENIIKLGSNENPLGASPKAVEAIIKHVHEISVYPSPGYHDLKYAIASYTGFHTSKIMVGNGSDDLLNILIQHLVKPQDTVVIPIPTYSYYEVIVGAGYGKCVFVNRNPDFSINAENVLDALTERTRIIFICSPNNPTGNIIRNEELVELLQSTECFIVLDEAYVEFSSESCINLVNEFNNLIVLRTFSKLFGLAGLRLGYAIANERITSEYNNLTLTFSVNQLAVRAGIAALSDEQFIEKTLGVVKEGRDYLTKNIPFKVYPSEANFMYVDVAPYTSQEISEYLLKNGIIVRECSTFRGCRQNALRITVGQPWQNIRIVTALSEFLINK
ncbi:MAG TPA: histidinol-phosphate transaminase [Candidatus Acidoferrales bacterium]|nr:histidinol-phosphate transaminase [Candidatus Acidoferrales bacterium]